MELTNHKVIRNFVAREEADSVLNWVNGIFPEAINPNHHLAALSKSVMGKAMMFDISDTEKTNYITNFQKVSKIVKDGVPDIVMVIIDRISKALNLPKDDVFLQAVDMPKGGKINPHYDAGISGYVNYKCNISVLSDDYDFFVGKDALEIQERDLYCFEASLYKHWTKEFQSRRVFLSIGFILPYSTVGRTYDDPRCRLSRRIEKYFQN